MRADERWASVVAHDKCSDGEFVYAVRTTGVYCRPSCPARRPLRRNVELFDHPHEAEAAGYRACLRCRPQEAGVQRTSRAALAVAEACRILETADEAPALADLGRLVGLSPYYLQRSFKRLVGSTPRQYAAGVRLERAKRSLRHGAAVTASIYDAGYGSSRAFYEQASAAFGMQPADYRRGGRAQTITYTTAASPLGAVLVAVTERGVCAVRFVADACKGTEVEVELRREFPAAVMKRDDDALQAAAARVVAAVGGGADDLDLPLDVRATAFQLRVWRALCAIPWGQTRSYTDVALSIGRPTAVRAVAGACAANPVAVVVPCHRVVAVDGSMAGYRWGVERKRALLDAERPGAPGSDPVSRVLQGQSRAATSAQRSRNASAAAEDGA